eukprot:s130_g11.t1
MLMEFMALFLPLAFDVAISKKIVLPGALAGGSGKDVNLLGGYEPSPLGLGLLPSCAPKAAGQGLAPAVRIAGGVLAKLRMVSSIAGTEFGGSLVWALG